jgi:CBS domain-containing protein
MERDTVTIPASLPFAEVQHLLVVAGIHGAPVVDERGRVVGIVSAIDLLRAADEARDPDLDEGEGLVPGAHLHALTALDLASPAAVWVAPDAPAAEVARLMRHEGIHRVLVGADGRLEGILTAFDLLRTVPDGGRCQL